MSTSEQLGPVAIVGTTSWGVTLGLLLSRRGLDVRVLARTEEEAGGIEDAREHPTRLPGYRFPDTLHVIADWAAGMDGASAVMFMVPSHTLRENARRAAPHIPEGALVVSGSKGLEQGTFKRMSTVLAEELRGNGSRHVVLSGPNLAREVVRGMPTATVIASEDEQTAREAQGLLNSPTFRVYTNSDVIGTEMGGALKNIVAIGAGMCDGMGLGDNAKAAFLTRGLAEITRLGVAAGAQPATFAGNAVLGDLLATCSSSLSRNYRVGAALAAGRTLAEALESLGGQVAEGVTTTPAALDMARDLGVEMPITEMTSRVLFGGASLQEAVYGLMARAPRSE